MRCSNVVAAGVAGLVSAVAAPNACGQAACPEGGQVASQHRITEFLGGFTGDLSGGDRFGVGVAGLGDVDGDGVDDLAVGARRGDDGGTNRGSVWVLFMNTDGTVRADQKISQTQGGFTGVLGNGDSFGNAVAGLGDLDGDGVPDLAAGALYSDDAGNNRGAVWILLLNTDGTVKASQKISQTQGGFTGQLDNGDHFGTGLALLGDFDGDGVADLAVGAEGDSEIAGDDHGAMWVLFLNTDGTVKTSQKISNTQGGATGVRQAGDKFSKPGLIGDLDGDGVQDLAVGAFADDDGGTDRGAVWIFFMNRDGTVKAHQKISDTQGGFTGVLADNDVFGVFVQGPGDLDGDGVADLLVGASNDDGDGGAGIEESDRGAFWLLYLNRDGTVKGHEKVSQNSGGFADLLTRHGNFGGSIAVLGDADGSGRLRLAVGAPAAGADEQPGEVWIVDLDVCRSLPALTVQPKGVLVDGRSGVVELSARAEGSGTLFYQWRKDGVELSDGPTITGSGTDTLTVLADGDDIGLYDVAVSNSFGTRNSESVIVALREGGSTCPADFDGSGELDVFDFLAFLNAFDRGCP